MSAAFTPGPWKLSAEDDQFVVSEQAFGETVAIADLACTSRLSPSVRLANARLVADAPTLLKSVKNLSAALSYAMNVMGDSDPLRPKCQATLSVATALLAKHEPEENQDQPSKSI